MYLYGDNGDWRQIDCFANAGANISVANFGDNVATDAREDRMIENPYVHKLRSIQASAPESKPAPEPFVPGPLQAAEHFTVGDTIPTPDGPRTVVGTTEPKEMFPNGLVRLRDSSGNVANWEPAVLLRRSDHPKSDVEFRRTWTTDPRSDVGEYSQQWCSLLGLAYDVDGAASDGLFSLLHGARCYGVDLEWTGRGWRLVPGQAEPDEWLMLKAGLAPHLSVLKGLLPKVTT